MQVCHLLEMGHFLVPNLSDGFLLFQNTSKIQQQFSSFWKACVKYICTHASCMYIKEVWLQGPELLNHQQLYKMHLPQQLRSDGNNHKTGRIWYRLLLSLKANIPNLKVVAPSGWGVLTPALETPEPLPDATASQSPAPVRHSPSAQGEWMSQEH